jgi:hypothetical protein
MWSFILTKKRKRARNGKSAFSQLPIIMLPFSFESCEKYSLLKVNCHHCHTHTIRHQPQPAATAITCHHPSQINIGNRSPDLAAASIKHSKTIGKSEVTIAALQ